MTEPKVRILIAEDDDADFGLMQMLFRENFPEAELMRSTDGEEVLQKLGEIAAPDAILLDFNMPRKDGRQTLREIRAVPDWEKIPIVVFTTSNFSEDRAFVKQLGGVFVSKPFSLDGYIAFVRGLSEACRTSRYSDLEKP